MFVKYIYVCVGRYNLFKKRLGSMEKGSDRKAQRKAQRQLHRVKRSIYFEQCRLKKIRNAISTFRIASGLII